MREYRRRRRLARGDLSDTFLSDVMHPGRRVVSASVPRKDACLLIVVVDLRNAGSVWSGPV